ncbi:MAG: hypothetical protein K2O00_06275 [Muribaculaceae bacterium]|nr:hypothetical protein [Muribaculaceae bacterium]
MKTFILALCLLSGFYASAQDYEKQFYELLEEKSYERADSIIKEWEAADKNNPEIFPARFNLLLWKSQNSIVVLDSNPDVEESIWVLTDSAGKPAGSVYSSVTINDSIYYEGIKVIDQGIELFPDRLDFRLGKAAAYAYKEDWEKLSKTVIEILEHGEKNRNAWIWTGNEPLDAKDATTAVLESIHEYEGQLIDNYNPMELLDANLKYYPDDHIALNSKGAVLFLAGKSEEALEYIERAHKQTPEDPLVSYNIGYINMELGNKEKALTGFQLVLDNENASEEMKRSAQENIDILNGKNK